MMKALVTLPTPQTLDRLRNIFMSAPISIPFEQMYAVLAYLPEDTPAPPSGKVRDVQYVAHFSAYQIMFNEVTNGAELVGVLESDAMKVRTREVGGPIGFLHKLVFLPYSPSQSQTVRNFNVSIADTLVLREGPFTFQNDYLLSS